MNNSNPVFIKVDEYKKILDIVDVFKKKVAQTNDTIEQIEILKHKEDEELASWKHNLAEIEKRTIIIDKTLFEPEV